MIFWRLCAIIYKYTVILCFIDPPREEFQKIFVPPLCGGMEIHMNDQNFRFATEDDAALILDFIRELAEYEKMSDQVVADETLLREWIFDRKKAEVIFALEDGAEVGFALFFHNFSTFLGRAGIYLEDLFVRPAYRGHGHGKGLLKELVRIAVERGCGRLELCCLDWNRPSIDFYLSLGAEPLDEWTTYRFSGESLRRMAAREGDQE